MTDQRDEMIEKLSAEVRSLHGQLVQARQGIALHAQLASKVASLTRELEERVRAGTITTDQVRDALERGRRGRKRGAK